MTVLERAVAAVAPIVFPGTGGAEPTPAMKRSLERLVRAVLTAIREPDETGLESAIAPYRYGNTDEFNAAYKQTVAGYWRTQIDAILSKEGTQDEEAQAGRGPRGD